MWRRVQSVGDRIAKVDGQLSELSRARPRERGVWWHEQVEGLLKERSELMTERDAPFVVSDHRRVRG